MATTTSTGVVTTGVVTTGVVTTGVVTTGVVTTGVVTTGVVTTGVVTTSNRVTPPLTSVLTSTGLTTSVVCFAGDCGIMTSMGRKRASDVILGDKLISLKGNEWHTVCGIYRIAVNGETDMVRFCRDGIGKGVPERDILLTPFHLVKTSLGKWVAKEYADNFGCGYGVEMLKMEIDYVYMFEVTSDGEPFVDCDGLEAEVWPLNGKSVEKTKNAQWRTGADATTTTQ